MLSALNEPGINISTVEDPVEYTLDGIHQVQVIREKGLDFSRALRSLMRQDPDIILVGETRDKETAQAAMEAALTGHMVFTTLHANDTATAITRLAEMEIPPYLIGASIIGVVAQRLVRKVCTSCSELKKINPNKNHLAASFGIKEARIISNKNKNCPICNGTGYKGRVGIYEVMKVNEVIRELIMKQANADQIREHAFDKSGRSLLMYGMNIVKNGMTTIEEVERVCLLSDSDNEEK
jgi:type IV pilus assembly protein PilB